MIASRISARATPRGARRVVAPARSILVFSIRAYRLTIGRLLPNRCRFYPSCSHYAEEAVRTHGVLKGGALAGWRLLRCQPFAKGGIDRVPGSEARGAGRQAYDTVLRTGRGAA